jgi:ADP-heptose:LPS heptosyltransferase
LPEPLTLPGPADAESLGRLRHHLKQLGFDHYDEIANLTFSPLSSWITKSLSEPNTRVRGYTRQADGWLRIAGDVPSRILTQVGPWRANRIHRTDLYAALLEVDLTASDWAPPLLALRDFGLPACFVAVHPGASDSGKRLPPFLWGRILKRAAELKPGFSAVVIGTRAETALASEIRKHAPSVPFIDLTGRTFFEDLFQVVVRARVLAGSDSSPMHVAALTQTPCLNVSVGDVNFWETGPKAAGSAVLRVERPEDLSSETAAQVLAAILAGGKPQVGFIARSGIPSFEPAVDHCL